MINRILNDIEDETCYYVGTNGCLYQDLEKEELYAIKNEIDKYKEVIDKIRKYLEKELQEYGGGGLAQEHLNEFNKLLEEINE